MRRTLTRRGYRKSAGYAPVYVRKSGGLMAATIAVIVITLALAVTVMGGWGWLAYLLWRGKS